MSLSNAVPALPVQEISPAAEFYRERFGFTVAYSDDEFAKLRRDEVELHLWASNDQGWKQRDDLREVPICTGAESFIAGTASCRFEVDLVDELYDEMKAAGVMHPGDSGEAVDTDWGTREFATVDLEGNLVTFYSRS